MPSQKVSTVTWVITGIFIFLVACAVAAIPISQAINKAEKDRRDAIRKRIDTDGYYTYADRQLLLDDGGPSLTIDGFIRGAKEEFKRFANDPNSVTFSEPSNIQWKLVGRQKVFFQPVLVRAKNGFGALVVKGYFVTYTNGKIEFDEIPASEEKSTLSRK